MIFNFIIFPYTGKPAVPAALVVVAVLLFLYMFGYHFPSQAQLESTGLPPKPEVFVNREQEQFDIINTLTTSGPNHSRIVTITGAPGHGKSALATVCGYTLHNMGLRIRHVDLQGLCSEEDVIQSILYILSSGTYDKRPTRRNLMLRVKKEFRDVIVILDNVDCFTLSFDEDLKNGFQDIMTTITQNSIGIHVILTTQYHLQFDTKTLVLHVPRLTKQHSVELLTQSNPNSLSQNQTKQLVQYADGIPLVLRIIQSILMAPNAPTIDQLLYDLSSDPIETLSPENVKMRLNRVFTIATNHLSENDHMCFIITSLFPRSFTPAAAKEILAQFVHDTKCLGRLQTRSLVEYNINRKHYFMIPLLKIHGQGLSTNDTKSSFNALFAMHHMQQFQNSAQTFGSPLAYLKKEIHDVTYVLQAFVHMEGSILSINESIALNETDMQLTVLQFTLESFEFLPFSHSIPLVEQYWLVVSSMCIGPVRYVLQTGRCLSNFTECLRFRLQLSELAFQHKSISSKLLLSITGIYSYELVSSHLKGLVTSKCTSVSDIVRLIVYTAKGLQHHGNHTGYKHTLNLLKAFAQADDEKSVGDSESDFDYSVGLLLYETQVYELAIEFLNRSLHNMPNNTHAANLMLRIHVENGRHDLALQSAESALQSFVRLNSTFKNLKNDMQEYLEYTWDNYESHWTSFSNIIERFVQAQEALLTLSDLVLKLNETSIAQSIEEHLLNSGRQVDIIVDILWSVGNADSDLEDYPLDPCNEEVPVELYLAMFIYCKDSSIANNIKKEKSRKLYFLELSSVLLFRVAYLLKLRLHQLTSQVKHMVRNVILLTLSSSDLISTKALSIMSSTLEDMTHTYDLYYFTAEDSKARNTNYSKRKFGDVQYHSNPYLQQIAVNYFKKLESKVTNLSVGCWKLNMDVVFELGLFLSRTYVEMGWMKEARNYTKRTLLVLPEVQVKHKVHQFLWLQFQLAYVEYQLGFYAQVLAILQNCSTTIYTLQLEHVGNHKYTNQSTSALTSLDLSTGLKKFVFLTLNLSWTSVLKEAKLSPTYRYHLLIIILFIVIFVVLFLCFIAIVIAFIDSHYFIYQLYTTRNPLYKMYYSTLYIDMPAEQPYLSLIVWASLPTRLKCVLITVSAAMTGSVAYYVHWHLYYILYYFNFV